MNKCINKKNMLKLLSVVLIIALLIAYFFMPKDKKVSNKIDLNAYLNDFIYSVSSKSYDTYISENAKVLGIDEEQTVLLNAEIKKGTEQSFVVNTNGGFAEFVLKYKIRSENNEDAVCRIKINGEQPFQEAASITLKRHWLTIEPENDNNGNQFSPELEQFDEWCESPLTDSSGYHNDPLRFALNAGENTISIYSEKNDLIIESLSLIKTKEIADYKTVSSNYSLKNNSVKTLTLEAEKPYLRTDTSIKEICDRSSAVTIPTFNGKQVWNAIGNNGWSRVGQGITWKATVKKAGYYKIAFRYLQNFNSGSVSYRKLLIDGEVPFKEATAIEFPFSQKWSTKEFSDEEGKAYLIYLDKGEHEIALEVTMGEMTTLLNVAQKSLYQLNTIYRKIIMLTGSSPDLYRDYQIAKKLPDVIEVMEEQSETLQSISDWLYLQSGKKGASSSVIDKIIWQLGEFVDEPESIPAELSTFQSNITSLSSWIQSATSQPLTLDCIQLCDLNSSTRKSDANFFANLFFELKQLIASYADDYGVVGNTYDGSEKSIDVWIPTGRDQYQILKSHIDNNFVPKYDINVNLKLVAGGLLQALAANTEPDIYMFGGTTEPMDYAARGVVYNLENFDDFDEVANRFSHQALVPFKYDGGTYAIPNTQSFAVMFTRDDLLAEMELEVPKTWDDVFNMLTILQQNKMEFAFPIPSSGSVTSYALMLFQYQENLYNENGKTVAINTPEAIQAFNDWIKLYRDYSSLMAYDFVNRFRTGDMPIGIVDFGTYNTLQLSAPEIKGLWSMHPVPGTLQADGTVKHISVSSSDSCLITKNTEYPKESWEFLKWWTSDEEQYAYATAIEDLLGASARFNTANIKAFERLSWSADTLDILQQQRKTALGIEQVPGGYFLSRHIDNIFRAVINKDDDIFEVVTEYTATINAEIYRKRLEFGLEGEVGESLS